MQARISTCGPAHLIQNQTNMLRKTLIISQMLLTALAAEAHIEPPKSVAERETLLNSRKKYREAGVLKSTAMQAGTDGKDRKLAEWIYDTQGRESNIVMFDAKDETKTHITQTYDRQGNLVLDADHDEEGRILEMNALEYNDLNLIKRVVSYDSSFRISGILEYTYLTDTVLATKYKPDFSIQYTIQYTYEAGKNTGAIQRDATGKLMIRTINRFGYDGLRSAKEVYNAAEKLEYYFTYSYNAAGDFSRIEKLGPDKALQRTDVYTYNAKGLPETIEVFDDAGKLIMRRAYIYTYITD